MSIASISSDNIDLVDSQIIPSAYGRASVLHGGYIYIHGGINDVNHRENTLYKINTETWVVEKLGLTGDNPKIDCHVACVIGNKIIFSMGGDGYNWYNDIRELDLDSLTVKKILVESPVKPGPRAGHFMIHINNKLYIGFGWNGQAALNDIWYFDLCTKCWHRIESRIYLSPRDSVSAGLIGKYIYIFGGGVGKEFKHEIVTIDTDTHNIAVKKLHDHHPSARAGGAHTDDTSNIYIIGGNKSPNIDLMTVYNPELDIFSHHKNEKFKKIGYGSNMHIVDDVIVVIQGMYNLKKQSRMRNTKILKIKFRDSKHEYNQKKKCFGYTISKNMTDISFSFNDKKK